MQFSRVRLESLGYTLPEEVVSTSELEQRLAPVYDRLRLPAGRLQLMTGIQERRFWPTGTLPGDVSIHSGQAAIEAAGIDPREIGCLIHGSVSRDHLEPATASRVHHALGLRSDCVLYDVSNACLGVLNGVLQAAALIELGEVRAALIVGSECGRPLVETTIGQLNEDSSLSRQEIKLAIASLTIGSASAAVLLTHESLSRGGSRLLAGVAHAHTEHHRLCHSGRDQALGDGDGFHPLMRTDSERLMREGVATGAAAFERFLAASGWTPERIDRSVCHQVGAMHRKLMLETLGLSAERDFATFPWLGNTGAAALPISLALAGEGDFLTPGDQVALLGIGSGINCVMLACDWQEVRVQGGIWQQSSTQRTTAVAGQAVSTERGSVQPKPIQPGA